MRYLFAMSFEYDIELKAAMSQEIAGIIKKMSTKLRETSKDIYKCVSLMKIIILIKIGYQYRLTQCANYIKEHN